MLCEAKTYNINVFLEEEWPHIFDQESAVLGRFLTPQVCLHCVGLLIFAYLFGFEPVGYKKMGMILSIGMFVASIFISRPYFYAEKQLKQCKTASPRSPVRKFNEQFVLFFFPYTFWCSCIGVFL
jgi:hypothetical protein